MDLLADIGLKLVLIVAIVLLVIIMILPILVVKEEHTTLNELLSCGYNKGDLVAFKNSTGISFNTINNSQAMKKQVDRFIAGEITYFMCKTLVKKAR